METAEKAADKAHHEHRHFDPGLELFERFSDSLQRSFVSNLNHIDHCSDLDTLLERTVATSGIKLSNLAIDFAEDPEGNTDHSQKENDVNQGQGSHKQIE